MKISASLSNAYEFACHQAACRPPTSGGTGGSRPHGPGGPVHMPTGKLVPTVAKRWVPGKDNVIGKYTPEQQAAVRARIDRAMGIKPQASLKQIAQDRMKQGPMRNVSNATLKPHGGMSEKAYRDELAAKRETEQAMRDNMYLRAENPNHVPAIRRRGKK